MQSAVGSLPGSDRVRSTASRMLCGEETVASLPGPIKGIHAIRIHLLRTNHGRAPRLLYCVTENCHRLSLVGSSYCTSSSREFCFPSPFSTAPVMSDSRQPGRGEIAAIMWPSETDFYSRNKQINRVFDRRTLHL